MGPGGEKGVATNWHLLYWSEVKIIHNTSKTPRSTKATCFHGTMHVLAHKITCFHVPAYVHVRKTRLFDDPAYVWVYKTMCFRDPTHVRAPMQEISPREASKKRLGLKIRIPSNPGLIKTCLVSKFVHGRLPKKRLELKIRISSNPG